MNSSATRLVWLYLGWARSGPGRLTILPGVVTVEPRAPLSGMTSLARIEKHGGRLALLHTRVVPPLSSHLYLSNGVHVVLGPIGRRSFNAALRDAGFVVDESSYSVFPLAYTPRLPNDDLVRIPR